MKKIIGLSGKKGSGKNTLARFVKNIMGHGEEFAFADPIKEIASKYMGISKELCYADNEVKNTTYTDWLWEEIPVNCFKATSYASAIACHNKITKNGKNGPMTVREVLQWIGTELFRENMHQDFWVKATLNKIKAYKEQYNKPIREHIGNISKWTDKWYHEDVFFITDVRFPNEVKAIKDAGGSVVRIYRDVSNVSDSHPSETSLDDFDNKTKNPNLVVNLGHKNSAYLRTMVDGEPFDYLVENNSGTDELKYIAGLLAEIIERIK